MSLRYKGAIISATPPTTSLTSASGSWTLQQQLQAQAAGTWPIGGPFYIENVFSTYLYTGNGSTQTITNNINLSTYGGLVWLKTRATGANNDNWLTNTTVGAGHSLRSNTTGADFTSANSVTGFTSSGFTLGNTAGFNENTISMAS